MKLARFVCRVPFAGRMWLSALSGIVVFSLLLSNLQAGAQETVLHNFKNNGLGGASPRGGLISDAAGNLYGTTATGGAKNLGTVFELFPDGSGGWKEKVLHSFSSSGIDGYNPFGTLILDAAGNLFGATPYGGRNADGVVFELSSLPSGAWTETILYAFGNKNVTQEGPYGCLILDAAGNLYGTTLAGGANGVGSVFELTSSSPGIWTQKVLHVFNNLKSDAYFPLGGLVSDAAGNLYGTTWVGGLKGQGTVFEMTPTLDGRWITKMLHSFREDGKDGYQPYASLILDSPGNLYGTTGYGGPYNGGTVFELTPQENGTWKETILHSFQNNGTDGYRPSGALSLDPAGNLYGTTASGGTYNGGTVFELKASARGWTEVLLHSFSDNGRDGSNPSGGPLVFDGAGNLYGTTVAGGVNGAGTVFAIKR